MFAVRKVREGSLFGSHHLISKYPQYNWSRAGRQGILAHGSREIRFGKTCAGTLACGG